MPSADRPLRPPTTPLTRAGLALLALATSASPVQAATDRLPNFLLVVVDDVGVDQSACYDRPHAERAPQPTLERLCGNGLVFNRAWANPYCSPTRAALLTGRLGVRTGVGEALGRGAPGLSEDETTLPEALAALDLGYTSALFGKWHLSDELDGVDHPNLSGFDHFAGAMGGEVDDFHEWIRVEDGEAEWTTDYATSRTVDDALAWIESQEGPWFAMVSFHAPHTPLHLPPLDLHSYDHLTGDERSLATQPEDYMKAMLEAADTELGRLLASMDPRTRADTVIIYLGDNGTPSDVADGTYPPGHYKGSLYQGGIHVPLVVSSMRHVPRTRRVPHIVHVSDVFATVVELAGGSLDEVMPEGVDSDSVSLLPYLEDPHAPSQRRTVVAERFGPNVRDANTCQAAFDGRYKLIRCVDGGWQYFDLWSDPDEERDLSESTLATGPTRALEALTTALDALPIPPDEALR